jgi:hypothetical protein
MLVPRASDLLFLISSVSRKLSNKFKSVSFSIPESLLVVVVVLVETAVTVCVTFSSANVEVGAFVLAKNFAENEEISRVGSGGSSLGSSVGQDAAVVKCEMNSSGEKVVGRNNESSFINADAVVFRSISNQNGSAVVIDENSNSSGNIPVVGSGGNIVVSMLKMNPSVVWKNGKSISSSGGLVVSRLRRLRE